MGAAEAACWLLFKPVEAAKRTEFETLSYRFWHVRGLALFRIVIKTLHLTSHCTVDKADTLGC